MYNDSKNNIYLYIYISVTYAYLDLEYIFFMTRSLKKKLQIFRTAP